MSASSFASLSFSAVNTFQGHPKDKKKSQCEIVSTFNVSSVRIYY